MTGANHFVAGTGADERTLVVVFLRGGADGLNLVAPFGDDGYFRARPRIALTRAKSVVLDDFFGLNPLLEKLGPLYRDGTLAVLHAVGSEDDTRSHFEAQDLMERGGELAAGGWVGRFLRALPGGQAGPLAAVAIGEEVPESLRGAPAATVVRSLEMFSLGREAGGFRSALGRLYASHPGLLGQMGRSTLDAMDRIGRLSTRDYRPANGAIYGDDEFSRGLREIAQLIKARVGLAAACIDLDGWDSHLTQWLIMDPLMTRLADGLSAFCRDLGRGMERATVVVMTEFGRRVFENASFGTDHGRGSVMFVLGGGVRGGQVIARWPRLDAGVLEGPGDLPVTLNYRDVLAPILARHGAGSGLDRVFPGFELKPVELFG